MDNINNQLQQLSKQLDGLTEGTAQYQVQHDVLGFILLPECSILHYIYNYVDISYMALTFSMVLLQGVAEEYNRLKDHKRVSVSFYVIYSDLSKINK